jgi:hypothetical protein
VGERWRTASPLQRTAAVAGAVFVAVKAPGVAAVAVGMWILVLFLRSRSQSSTLPGAMPPPAAMERSGMSTGAKVAIGGAVSVVLVVVMLGVLALAALGALIGLSGGGEVVGTRSGGYDQQYNPNEGIGTSSGGFDPMTGYDGHDDYNDGRPDTCAGGGGYSYCR